MGLRGRGSSKESGKTCQGSFTYQVEPVNISKKVPRVPRVPSLLNPKKTRSSSRDLKHFKDNEYEGVICIKYKHRGG